MKIYMVTYTDYEVYEVHSLWLDPERAEQQKEEVKGLNAPFYSDGYWDVEERLVEDAPSS